MNTKENINLLRDIIQKEQKVAVFVGSGTSNFLGIKGWDDVLVEMAREFNAQIDVSKSIKEEGFAKTATKIYETKNDIAFYKAFMSKQFIPKKAYHYSLHIKLINLFDTFLTTNFDTCFESAFDDLNGHLTKCKHHIRDYKTQKLPQFEHSEILKNPTLVYLHGNNDNEEYIFKEDEYRTHYPSCFSIDANSRLEDFLKFIFREFVLVFIGFSFDDNIFVQFHRDFRIREKRYYEEYIKIHGRPSEEVKLPEHFIIMPEEYVTPKLSRNKVIAIFESDTSWESYFEDKTETDLIFKKNVDEIIVKDIEAESDPDNIRKKKNLRHMFTLTRYYLFKMAYLRPIIFEENDYIQIENIMKSLSEAETEIGHIDEAAYA